MLRFEKFLSPVEYKTASFTVNDLGWFYGEKYKYMIKNKCNIKHYWGTDISEKMIYAANKCNSSKNTTFLLADKFSQKTDYYFSSGIINVRVYESIKIWESCTENTLFHFNNFSSKGFAFNILTSTVRYKEDHLYYANSI